MNRRRCSGVIVHVYLAAGKLGIVFEKDLLKVNVFKLKNSSFYRRVNSICYSLSPDLTSLTKLN